MSSSQPAAGRTLGHYRILEQIGAGGMGVVYRARDERLHRDVAVKVLPPGALADDSARARFRREALALSRLNHPNIATVHDFDSDSGADFLVTELVQGTTLDERLTGGALPENEVIKIGAQLAEGLAAAHREGVVHRDLKPANLRLTPDGWLKILDFGVAKLMPTSEQATLTQGTREGDEVAGTLAYMAPEQVKGERVDARADLWAAGVVLYELATGKRPFQARTAGALTDQILHGAVAPPRSLQAGLSPRLEDIILKCLEKEADSRYQSAKELLIDLRRLGRPAMPGPSSTASRRPVMFALAAAAVLALIVAAALYFRHALAPAGLPRISSLAVLPLANLSGNPEQEFFADGMTEALITDLSQIKALKVISRTSVMRYKGSNKPLREIARELGVDGIVEGSVVRSGNRVRITAQLINAASDTHLWAENFDRDLRDVLAMQDDVGRAIAAQVQAKLTAQEQARLTSARQVDPEAYELYLKGRHYWSRRTEQELYKAIGYFRQAIEKDPNYAQAYSGLADSYVILNIRGYASAKDTNANATQAARKAVELDDTLAETHTSLARALANDRDWLAADREFRRALELNPGYVEAYHGYSHYLVGMGRMAESLEASKRSLQLAPLDTTMAEHLGWHYLMAGDFQAAIEANRKAFELDPNGILVNYTMGQAFEARGMYDEAIAAYQRTVTLSNGNPESLAGLAHAYAVAGKRTEALKLRDQLAATSKERYVSPYYMATIYAGLGDSRQALKLLRDAYDDRSGLLTYVRSEPRLAPLRSDPRFQEIVKLLQFPP